MFTNIGLEAVLPPDNFVVLLLDILQKKSEEQSLASWLFFRKSSMFGLELNSPLPLAKSTRLCNAVRTVVT